MSMLEGSSCDRECILYLTLLEIFLLLISVLNSISEEFYYNAMYGDSKVSP